MRKGVGGWGLDKCFFVVVAYGFPTLLDLPGLSNKYVGVLEDCCVGGLLFDIPPTHLDLILKTFKDDV